MKSIQSIFCWHLSALPLEPTSIYARKKEKIPFYISHGITIFCLRKSTRKLTTHPFVWKVSSETFLKEEVSDFDSTRQRNQSFYTKIQIKQLTLPYNKFLKQF